MKKLIVILLTLYFVNTHAQEKIFLYPSTQKVTKDDFDMDKEPPYFQVFRALPDSANGSAILICPGGGYGHLADQHEGADVAKFYNDRGFDAFVLHYRLNNQSQQGHRYPAQYNDVTMAMRIIKSRAKEWKIDPDRIGVIGFSAGGHLASTLGTMIKPANKKSSVALEKISSRPAFMMLIYPVISMNSKYTPPWKHGKSFG
ncbi:MAG: alpha/beta hydrolase [Bacteroidota bacterium]